MMNDSSWYGVTWGIGDWIFQFNYIIHCRSRQKQHFFGFVLVKVCSIFHSFSHAFCDTRNKTDMIKQEWVQTLQHLDHRVKVQRTHRGWFIECCLSIACDSLWAISTQGNIKVKFCSHWQSHIAEPNSFLQGPFSTKLKLMWVLDWS